MIQRTRRDRRAAVNMRINRTLQQIVDAGFDRRVRVSCVSHVILDCWVLLLAAHAAGSRFRPGAGADVGQRLQRINRRRIPTPLYRGEHAHAPCCEIRRTLVIADPRRRIGDERSSTSYPMYCRVSFSTERSTTADLAIDAVGREPGRRAAGRHRHQRAPPPEQAGVETTAIDIGEPIGQHRGRTIPSGWRVARPTTAETAE